MLLHCTQAGGREGELRDLDLEEVEEVLLFGFYHSQNISSLWSHYTKNQRFSSTGRAEDAIHLRYEELYCAYDWKEMVWHFFLKLSFSRVAIYRLYIWWIWFMLISQFQLCQFPLDEQNTCDWSEYNTRRDSLYSHLEFSSLCWVVCGKNQWTELLRKELHLWIAQEKNHFFPWFCSNLYNSCNLVARIDVK